MANNKRTPIPKKIQESLKEKNLFVCCICKERGLGVNLHHIDGNPNNNTENNLAVLCVKEHDRYHRPHAYDILNHLELGAEKINKFKVEWEETVIDCKTENPKVIAVVNCYGSYENIHSVRYFLQNLNGKIIYERIYHLLLGTPEQWVDNIIDEINWLGKNVKLSLIDKPLQVEYCPCCSNSLSNVLDKNVVVHLTAKDWDERSIASIYINPTNPSIALTIFYNNELIFSSHLHKCNKYLHFMCDNYEERVPIKRNPSIRTQAKEIINKIITVWEPKIIFYGTGDSEKPVIIKCFDLPQIWER